MTDTLITRRASCFCGQLTLVAAGEPVRVSVCHCLDCQKRSGSAFAVQARYERSQVHVAGESKAFVRLADSGNAAAFNFCPNCGGTVFYIADAVPGFVTIPIGAFADPAFPPPRVSVYEKRMHPWVQLSGDLERIQ